MARRSNDGNAEPLHVIVWVAERVDLYLARIARASADLADGERPSEQLFNLFFQPASGELDLAVIKSLHDLLRAERYGARLEYFSV